MSPVGWRGAPNNPTATAAMSPRQQLDLREGEPDRAASEAEGRASGSATRAPAGGGSREAGRGAAGHGGPVASGRRHDPRKCSGASASVRMRAEIESLDRQIEFKEVRGAAAGSVIGDYQSRIEAVPGVESEYLALTRDYDTIQESFKDLLDQERGRASGREPREPPDRRAVPRARCRPRPGAADQPTARA